MAESFTKLHGLDDKELYSKTWAPQGEDKNTRIVVVHGFGNEVDDFASFAADLAKDGFEVIVFDQRGWGKTAKSRKEYGYSSEYYVFEDLDAVLRTVTAKYAGHVLLYGHSMGGGIVLNYLVKGKLRERVDGYFVTGPLVEPHSHVSSKGINRFMAPLLPLATKLFPKMRRLVYVDVNYVSHDQALVKERTPQASRRNLASTVLAYDMLERGRRLKSSVFVSKAVDRPVFVAHGKEDRIADIAGVREFAALLKVSNKKFLEYEGAYHELFAETPEYKDRFYGDLIKWIAEVRALPVHYDPKAEAKEPEEPKDDGNDEANDESKDSNATEAVAGTAAAAGAAGVAGVAATGSKQADDAKVEPETDATPIETKEVANKSVAEPETKEVVAEPPKEATKEVVSEPTEVAKEAVTDTKESTEPVAEPKETTEVVAEPKETTEAVAEPKETAIADSKVEETKAEAKTETETEAKTEAETKTETKAPTDLVAPAIPASQEESTPEPESEEDNGNGAKAAASKPAKKKNNNKKKKKNGKK